MTPKRKTRYIEARLTRGKKLRIPAWSLDSERPGPCLLLLAALHGNEVQGIEAIRQFMDLAAGRLKAGKVLAVSFGNLPATGMLDGDPEPADRPILFSDQVGRAPVAAPCTGVFARVDLEVGQKVRKGQLLGTLLSDEDLECHQITAPASGYLRCYDACRGHCDVALPAQHPYVSKGDRLAEIVWRR